MTTGATPDVEATEHSSDEQAYLLRMCTTSHTHYSYMHMLYSRGELGGGNLGGGEEGAAKACISSVNTCMTAAYIIGPVNKDKLAWGLPNHSATDHALSSQVTHKTPAWLGCSKHSHSRKLRGSSHQCCKDADMHTAAHEYTQPFLVAYKFA